VKKNLIQHLTRGNDFIIKSSNQVLQFRKIIDHNPTSGTKRVKDIEASSQKSKRGSHKYQIFMGNNGKLVNKVMMEGCPGRAMMWFEAPNL
jgi:hypothetical protein